MAYSQFTLDYLDNQKIYGNSWTNDDKSKVKGAVVIIHGMAEYSFRYDDLAKFLVKNGFDVYAPDHIGHGLAVSKEEKPVFGYGDWPKDGFDQSIERVYEVVKHVHTLTDKPVFVFGHSLGSFLGTGFYERHSDSIKAAIICGSAYNNSTYKMSCMLTGVMNAFMSKKKKHQVNKMLVDVSNKTLNKGLAPFADGYDSNCKWLSFNEDNVKKYDDDPECGFPCSFMFYYSMFHGQQVVWKKKNIKAVKDKKPLFVIAGASDPVGNYGKDVKNLYNFFSAAQDNVTLKIYENRRHEIHNDNGKEEVYNDILKFFTDNLA
ncbi:MAG: alpha/beta hydrolase [Bacilli bacterium]|jgi:alpha-beta hydrolase superfamily lysophospholipase|nr:alpha/beta hydrolase [Bacilli bacterium]